MHWRCLEVPIEQARPFIIKTNRASETDTY